MEISLKDRRHAEVASTGFGLWPPLYVLALQLTSCHHLGKSFLLAPCLNLLIFEMGMRAVRWPRGGTPVGKGLVTLSRAGRSSYPLAGCTPGPVWRTEAQP